LIIVHYLIREICKPFAAILGILMALFASYSAASFLSDAVNGLLATDTIMALIALKVLISLEVLIPVSLYMSVVLAFGRLYGDSEFTAMFALRVTPARVMGAVLALSAGLAFVVAGLSLIVRPLAYEKLHALSQHAELTLDVDAMVPGTFYVGKKGQRVIFFAHRDGSGAGAPARDVFVQLRQGDRTRIIFAKLAYPLDKTAPDSLADVYLSDAHVYDIARGTGQTDQVLTARAMVVNPSSGANAPPEYSSVAAGSAFLAASRTASDIAELQWRLSTPLTTLLLGMLGVPLSRAMPRQGKYAKFGTAILVYSGYYLLFTSARTWVQHGVIGPFPGIWWVPALLALFLLGALYKPKLTFGRERSMRLSPSPLAEAPTDALSDHGAA
jgi:lipopolysaccharide export system permease protein